MCWMCFIQNMNERVSHALPSSSNSKMFFFFFQVHFSETFTRLWRSVACQMPDWLTVRAKVLQVFAWLTSEQNSFQNVILVHDYFVLILLLWFPKKGAFCIISWKSYSLQWVTPSTCWSLVWPLVIIQAGSTELSKI